MREADLMRADRDGKCRLLVLQLPQYVVHYRIGRAGRGRLNGRARLGALHGLRIDVVPEPQEHPRAQHAVGRPVLELHLGDELGPDPARWAVKLGRLGEGADIGLEGLAARLHLCERALVEPGPHVSGVLKFPAAPMAEKERPERLARALAPGVAADDELAALRGLDLEPQARALARLVSTVLALGDGAFEAARERRCIQRLAVLGGV